mgnify:CR=1 FL=1
MIIAPVKIRKAISKLHPDDRKLLKKFLKSKLSLVVKGESINLITSAESEIKPLAIDWEKILEILVLISKIIEILISWFSVL